MINFNCRFLIPYYRLHSAMAMVWRGSWSLASLYQKISLPLQILIPQNINYSAFLVIVYNQGKGSSLETVQLIIFL